MRLGVYADLMYWRDDDAISTSTAFVSWLAALGGEVDELIVFGRVRPGAGRANYSLAGPNIRFVALPYYDSLQNLRQVASGAVRSIARWQRELKACDAVVLFGPHPLSVIFGLQAKAARRPVIVGVRQDFPEYLSHRAKGWRRRLAVPTARALEAAHRRLGRGGGVIAVGDEMARRYAQPRSRVFVTGVSLVRSVDIVPLEEAVSRPWPGKCEVLVAGRLDPEKNPLLLLEVASELQKAGQWTLLVAGTGSLKGQMAAQVRSRSLEHVVKLLGRLEPERLRELYLEATVFVHVSLTEGQPQVLYEAAAAGIPIVATAVGGVPGALASGERGELVPPNDASAVAEAIARLGGQPERRRSMVQAAWQWATTETQEVQVARVARFIGEIVEASGRRPRT